MEKVPMLFYALSLVVLLLCTSIFNLSFAQTTSPTANSSNTSAVATTTSSNTASTVAGAGGSQLIKKIEKIPSLSNIITMSLIDGIKVSGINLGDTDLTLTLKRQTAGTNITSPSNTTSLPVTILVTKLPVNNITQLISTAESTIRLAQASRSSGATGSLVGGESLIGGESSGAAGADALQILNLLKDVQIGTASIVNANWTTPQTISMGLFGLGNRVAATAPSDFVLVTVIPFQGETSLATLPLK